MWDIGCLAIGIFYGHTCGGDFSFDPVAYEHDGGQKTIYGVRPYTFCGVFNETHQGYYRLRTRGIIRDWNGAGEAAFFEDLGPTRQVTPSSDCPFTAFATPVVAPDSPAKELMPVSIGEPPSWWPEDVKARLLAS